MKLNTDPDTTQITKIVKARRLAQWGSEKWIGLTSQLNSLMLDQLTRRQATLLEHIKNFWK
jgi:hypothetical protein